GARAAASAAARHPAPARQACRMTAIRHAFVIGQPIAHSRSPLIHRHWLAEYGLSGRYDPIEVAPEDLGAFLDALRRGAFVGGNVTVPHKEAVFRLMAGRTDAV